VVGEVVVDAQEVHAVLGEPPLVLRLAHREQAVPAAELEHVFGHRPPQHGFEEEAV
jgi:hypothetical protein